ncbi:insulinase family protein [Clostridium niameyense]|uniref:Insulinase family protein n=1 Tax=Clostridium niameyense TaxID=1622073 RepID=A0A6M0R6N4_9CLOT|nr:pitrilysin family protein [Clostridium niameyense]NEZ45834.1 insulinase family protein [Clostridium niameyense]
MDKIILKNGMTFLYKKNTGNITSLCIGFNAGALEENEFSFGTAHAVEHMVSKGTLKRSEQEINNLADSIFGFENAMTNYPYVVYYGSLLKEDFEKALDFYSDMLINPAFNEQGFKEEMEIILEELKEWKEDNYQYCEDTLLKNVFKKQRIKELIIGNEESVKNIKLIEVKEFYNKYYTPKNCVISVVSSMEMDVIESLIEKYFKDFKREFNDLQKVNYEKTNSNKYINYKKGIEGAKILYSCAIEDLNKKEIEALKIFNEEFGCGTSSMLFNEIRTKRSLAYDVGSLVKNERGIKLFNFYVSTSKDKVDVVLKTLEDLIEDAKNINGYFTQDKIESIVKNIRLKVGIRHESSIRLAMDMTVYELMYKSNIDNEFEYIKKINEQYIKGVISKVLEKRNIQILK